MKWVCSMQIRKTEENLTPNEAVILMWKSRLLYVLTVSDHTIYKHLLTMF